MRKVRVPVKVGNSICGYKGSCHKALELIAGYRSYSATGPIFAHSGPRRGSCIWGRQNTSGQPDTTNGCDHTAVEGTFIPAPAAPAATRAGQPLAGRGTSWEDAGGLRSPGGVFPTGLWHNSV